MVPVMVQTPGGTLLLRFLIPHLLCEGHGITNIFTVKISQLATHWNLELLGFVLLEQPSVQPYNKAMYLL